MPNGRRKTHRGRRGLELWVVGGLERDSNPQRIFLEAVVKRNSRTLGPLLVRRITSGTRVVTDGWGGYVNLSTLGFDHVVVNHSENFVNPTDPEVNTQGIENVWCVLRRFLRGKGTYTRKGLSAYLSEFLSRKYYCDVFETMISCISEQYTF